uniref:Neprilysin n=1 Tax=Panagrellus redivivus TaxID=6233 RepID=A0A7E4VTN0_PANRE
MATFCHLLLASTFLSFLFIKYKSNYNKGGPEPPGFNDSLIPRPPEVCRTRDCVTAAALYHTYINRKVDPCRNFYEFTCGNFHLYHNIPPGQSTVDALSVMEERVHKQLHKSLLATSTKPEEPYEILTKSFFRKCMDAAKVDATGIASLLEYLKKFDGGVPFLGGAGFTTSWEAFLASVLKFTDMRLPISVSSYPDPADSTKILPQFGQGGSFILKDHKNYAKGMQNEIVQFARNMLIKVAVKLGASQTTAEQDVKDVLELATKLAAAIVPSEEARRSDSRSVVKFGELKAKYPEIAFQDIVDTFYSTYLTFNDDTRVVLAQPTYFDKLTGIMKATPKKVIANMMIMQFIAGASKFLSKDILELFHDFEMFQKGFKSKIPFNRLDLCVSSTNSLFPLPTSRLYVKDHFDLKKVQPKLEEITSYIKKAFIKELKESKWLDDSTRNRAIKKVNAMTQIIGYPKIIFDDNYMRKKYENYESSPETESLLELVSRLNNIGNDARYKEIRNPVTDDEIFTQSIVELNAGYMSTRNVMIYFAAILQYSVFMTEVPSYIQFGSIGMIIGHELQHGYDEQGRRYDENGNLNNWWQSDALKTFSEKKDCFIKQYDDEGVNGRNSVTENMADNAGLKTAFDAYKLWLEEHPDEVEMKMPGFGEYTNEQMFYISWANNWCGLVDEETAKLVHDPHLPSNIRSKVAVRNSAELNSAFNCPKNTAKTCRLW